MQEAQDREIAEDLVCAEDIKDGAAVYVDEDGNSTIELLPFLWNCDLH